MKKEKQNLRGKEGDDPEWIKDIPYCFFTYKNNSDEYKRELRELYLNYIIEGKKSKQAFEKAKRNYERKYGFLDNYV